jgi:mitochondrial fission protein ELM1
MTGPNPYFGILACADLLVVTSDSVSMISEALGTDTPVEVFDAPTNDRQSAYIDVLVARGLVQRSIGRPAQGVRTPINATKDVADAIHARLFGNPEAARHE